VDDDGNDVPVRVTGELLLKNAAMMAGYFGDPERTEAALVDGWLHTGDSAWQDEDGYFYFVDRRKDIVRRRGENISSLEVERAVQEHPAVLEAAVVGVPSEMTDEDVLVYVVLRPGTTLAPEEIVAWCRDRLAPFKVPRYVEYIDALPKTETSKVQKAKLRGLEPQAPGGRYDAEPARR
jgi:crotonobetaine/carnitine-CoA ligase